MAQDRIEPSDEARRAREESALDRLRTERAVQEADEVLLILNQHLESNHITQKVRAVLAGIPR